MSLIRPPNHRKYLSDPTEDVRVATENLLADFLREIRDISEVRRRREELTPITDNYRSDEAQLTGEPAVSSSESDTRDQVNEPKVNGTDHRGTGGRVFTFLRYLTWLIWNSLGPWSRSPDRLCCYRRDSHRAVGWPTYVIRLAFRCCKFIYFFRR